MWHWQDKIKKLDLLTSDDRQALDSTCIKIRILAIANKFTDVTDTGIISYTHLLEFIRVNLLTISEPLSIETFNVR